MYEPVDLHKKKSQALIIHCSDPRFQSAYRQFIDEIGQYYDLMVLPGASKAVLDNKMVLEGIKMLHGLHRFKSIYVLDHAECGAFGPLENELKAHKDAFKQASELLKIILPSVSLKGYLLGQSSAQEI